MRCRLPAYANQALRVLSPDKGIHYPFARSHRPGHTISANRDDFIVVVEDARSNLKWTLNEVFGDGKRLFDTQGNDNCRFEALGTDIILPSLNVPCQRASRGQKPRVFGLFRTGRQSYTLFQRR